MWVRVSEKIEARKKLDELWDTLSSPLIHGSFLKFLYQSYWHTILYISYCIDADGNVYIFFYVSFFLILKVINA